MIDPKESRTLKQRFEDELAQRLLDQGVVPRPLLEEALHQQVVLGGHLATNLIELGLADLERLTQLSADILDVPIVDAAETNVLASAVLRILPRPFVQRARMVPLGISGRVLRVATCEPWDLTTLGEAAFMSGYPVQPFFLPEVPLVRSLEKLYGLPAPPRFRELPTLARRRVQAAGDSPRVAVQSARHAPVIAPKPPASDMAPPLKPMESLDAAYAALAEAEDRDAVSEVVARFALSKGRRVALFVRRGEVWIGWFGAGEGVDLEALRALALPSAAGSIFGLVGSTRGPYVGPLAAHAVHHQLLRALGKARPRSIGLFPVHYRGKLAYGIYLDGGDRAFMSPDVGDILLLAQRVPEALAALVARRLRANV